MVAVDCLCLLSDLAVLRLCFTHTSNPTQVRVNIDIQIYLFYFLFHPVRHDCLEAIFFLQDYRLNSSQRKGKNPDQQHSISFSCLSLSSQLDYKHSFYLLLKKIRSPTKDKILCSATANLHIFSPINSNLNFIQYFIILEGKSVWKAVTLNCQ